MRSRSRSPINDKASYGAAGQTALAAMASWVKDGLMLGKLDPPTAPGLFLGGRSGFLLGGDWNRPTLAGAEAKHQLTFQYEILPLPKFYQTQRSWADSHSFAMPGKNHKLSPQKLAAVLQFIAYVEKHALIWGGGGHIPAYLPVTNSAAYRALKPNDEYRHAADIVAYDPSAWFAGVAGPLYQIAARDLNAGMNGQMPVDRAMTDMTEGINQIQR